MTRKSRFKEGLASGRTQHSGGRTIPTKRLFKENAPLIFFILMGPFARTLFSRTLLPWPILCYSGQILHVKVLEHLVLSNTSGFQFLGPLARTHFLSTLCGRYRVTGNCYITVFIFPGINFGIALHSLYRKYFSAEIILLYITFLDRNP